MYRLTVIKRFAAAHRLVNYQGQCARLHGHTWTVEVSVGGEKLDSCGMLIDFRALKELVGKIVGELDHSYLNDLHPFNELNFNPTAENLARHIFYKLKSLLPPDLTMSEVRVWESPDVCASYREDVIP
ncbi:6-carboxytetrahydropterin synthase QueD [Desulfofundulus salinus]|uniref:6-carboxy-5,6,7,8-tetrahydropterin synthase n=1 Tax=Desulfofundulus salinus TaxID=2419843 RepID=A0A494WY09_9FIRM|nr:6-carboxytetrahydropterin synthase QueD [Desulfofundulus salinum]RKO67202.1 6-carboxytetrahydropterin synthase QueD [Desulfofundulus salinum]